jgi:hypothetical protein
MRLAVVAAIFVLLGQAHAAVITYSMTIFDNLGAIAGTGTLR